MEVEPISEELTRLLLEFVKDYDIFDYIRNDENYLICELENALIMRGM